MSQLILRCPQKPSGSSSQEWNSDELTFEWSFLDGAWQTGPIENVPLADEVIALLPTIDIRLMDIKVPKIHDNKLKTILPSLIEEEILSPLSQTEIQLLPVLTHQVDQQRTIAIIDASWFKWLYEQLATLLANKIKLIPEFFAIPLAIDAPVAFVHEQTEHKTITYRFDLLKAISWAQPQNIEFSLPTLLPKNCQFSLLSDAVIQVGIQQIDRYLTPINLLPQRFYQLRKKSKKQINDWTSADLWQSPLKWALICLSIFFLSKLGYISYLSWVDYQWQKRLSSFANTTLGTTAADSLKALPALACQSARKNGIQCSGEFLPMITQLDGLLQALPPDSLIGINYSQEGLIFELAPNTDPKLLKLNPANKNLMIQRINASQFILRPFAGLGVETK